MFPHPNQPMHETIPFLSNPQLDPSAACLVIQLTGTGTGTSCTVHIHTYILPPFHPLLLHPSPPLSITTSPKTRLIMHLRSPVLASVLALKASAFLVPFEVTKTGEDIRNEIASAFFAKTGRTVDLDCPGCPFFGVEDTSELQYGVENKIVSTSTCRSWLDRIAVLTMSSISSSTSIPTTA